MLGVVCVSTISESLRYRADIGSEGSCFLIFWTWDQEHVGSSIRFL